MEYVFGTKETAEGVVEILKTVGDTNAILTGRQSVIREYTDKTYEDTFTIVRLYQQKKDIEGKCYHWYEIKDHFRTAERFTAERAEAMDQELENHASKIDYIAMMTDIDIEEV